MPQLDKEAAERTAGWEMEDGLYEVELKAVYDVDPKTKAPYVGKESGVPFWNWVVVFPDDANGGRFKRREIWRVISTGETSDGMRAEAFIAFGMDPSDNTDKGIGKRALARVESEEYDGVTRPKIKAFYPLADGAKTTGAPSKGATKAGNKPAAEEKALY